MIKFDMLLESWYWLCGYGCAGYDCPTEAFAYAGCHSHKCRQDS